MERGFSKNAPDPRALASARGASPAHPGIRTARTCRSYAKVALAGLVLLGVRVTRTVPWMAEMLGAMIRLPWSLGEGTQDGVDVACSAGARRDVRRGESIKDLHDPPAT